MSATATSTTSILPTAAPLTQPSQPAIAIGAGIGVPLGIAAIGFLSLMFWREMGRRKHLSRLETMRLENDTTHTVPDHDTNVQIGNAELWDIPLRRELRELNSDTSNIELQGIGPRQELAGDERSTGMPLVRSDPKSWNRITTV